MKKFIVFLLLLCCAFVFVGCGDNNNDNEEVVPTKVTINEKDVTVKVGDTVNLTTTVEPSGASKVVEWSSDKESVATVSAAGKVKGVSEGVAKITATCKANPNIKASIDVTVTAVKEDVNPDDNPGDDPEPTVEINSIELSFDDTVYVDFEFKVTSVVDPTSSASSLEWTSSNEEVATVSSKGYVKGIAPGTATIKAQIGDVFDTVEITVVARPDLESFVLTGAHDIETTGACQLTPETTPMYAKLDLEWTIDDETVATVDATGLVKPIKEGTVTVTATDKETSLSQTATIKIEKPFDPNDVKPTSVTISGDQQVYVGYSIQFIAQVLPAGVSQKVIWESSDETLATINEEGILLALQTGTVRIKAISAVDNKIKSTTIRVTIEEEPKQDPPQNLGGYKIVIMNADSALAEIDPFLEGYSQSDKSSKQQAWREVEEQFNCKISVEAYPATAPWGPQRVDFINDNAMNNTSQCDFAVTAAAWLYQFVQAESAVDCTKFFNKYGKGQIEASLKDAGQYKNKLYVMSTGLSETKVYPYKGLFYNYKMLKQYGLESPAKLFNENKWSYEDFVEYCLAAQAVLPEGTYVMSGASSIIWSGMVNAAGIKLADKTLMKLNLQHVYSLDAARALREIYEAGAWDPENMTSVDESVTSFQGGTALFQGGEYWFVRSSNRFPADLWGDDTEYGYVPFPYPKDVGKDNTMVNNMGDSLLLMVSGRSYPAGVEAEYVYRAVLQMYLNTIVYEKASDGYNPSSLKYNAVKSRIDDPESIDATIYFTASKTLYDPFYEQSFQYEWSGESATAIKNAVVNGTDPATEFAAIESAVLLKFQQIYAA